MPIHWNRLELVKNIIIKKIWTGIYADEVSAMGILLTSLSFEGEVFR
jgi:hypothetical protein